jgi:activator of HSP90 ATPase
MMGRLKTFALAALAIASLAAAKAAPEDPSAVHQEVDIPLPAARIYAALLDAKKFARITGSPAKIDGSAGGAFSLFGGAIGGRNVELVPDSMVVQAWRDNDWAPGVYSMVRFKLTPQGSSTHLVLDQTGFPKGEFHSLTVGWPAHYWTPLKSLPR